MWKCPKCGREFKNQNQQHYCGDKPKTVDEYIEAQDADIRERLQELREAIGSAIPQAQEKISWSMPTFWNGRNLIHFAAAKHHIGLYPGEEAVVHFESELAGFKTSKGTIQLPHKDPLPLDLIQSIAKFCEENCAKK